MATVNMGARGAASKTGAVAGRQRRCELAGSGRATTVSSHTRGRVLAGTRGHGPSWAAGKRALPLKLFPKFQNQYKLCNSNW
jgi:hypothetical protein